MSSSLYICDSYLESFAHISHQSCTFQSITTQKAQANCSTWSNPHSITGQELYSLHIAMWFLSWELWTYLISVMHIHSKHNTKRHKKLWQYLDQICIQTQISFSGRQGFKIRVTKGALNFSLFCSSTIRRLQTDQKQQHSILKLQKLGLQKTSEYSCSAAAQLDNSTDRPATTTLNLEASEIRVTKSSEFPCYAA